MLCFEPVYSVRQCRICNKQTYHELGGDITRGGYEACWQVGGTSGTGAILGIAAVDIPSFIFVLSAVICHMPPVTCHLTPDTSVISATGGKGMKSKNSDSSGGDSIARVEGF